MAESAGRYKLTSAPCPYPNKPKPPLPWRPSTRKSILIAIYLQSGYGMNFN